MVIPMLPDPHPLYIMVQCDSCVPVAPNKSLELRYNALLQKQSPINQQSLFVLLLHMRGDVLLINTFTNENYDEGVNISSSGRPLSALNLTSQDIITHCAQTKKWIAWSEKSGRTNSSRPSPCMKLGI
ncbi:hypothetical protein RRG08_066054 [Elysia crispata]|uniref:Uncharacterized protein n=1 Tax=Elysia crispata TaxID=231223 RepID=A0AAE1CS65_9GAST|nr:hypothetical protein RRG08_066054 [Elysia crispata]